MNAYSFLPQPPKLVANQKKKVCLVALLFLLVPFNLYLPLGLPTRAAAQTLDRQFNGTGTNVDLRQEADLLLRLGSQQERGGALDKAIESWSSALNLYQRIGDLDSMGIAYGYMGLAYANLGRFREAEDASRRRLGIARTNRDFQGQVFALNNVGTMLLQRGSIQAAQESFQEALDIARGINHTAGQGLSLSNLGLAAAVRARFQSGD
uniref:Uncharacterized protein n=1 Tax=Desertifilum tharense IPPAS B-1220 TaxID=1781255 RepID=A0ACD5GPT7_9CYAN